MIFDLLRFRPSSSLVRKSWFASENVKRTGALTESHSRHVVSLVSSYGGDQQPARRGQKIGACK